MTNTMTQQTILRAVQDLQKQKETVIIAIDGRCGSGKSTLGKWLQEQTHGQLIHMDDFFLRPEQRTAERNTAPGENVDHERFLKEVLLPLSRHVPFSYQPYDCRTQTLQPAVDVSPTAITIIEGSYSLRPDLQPYYDMKIFLSVDAVTQKERIQKRNPDRWEDFRTKWIPLEEKYFTSMQIENSADFVWDNSK